MGQHAVVELGADAVTSIRLTAAPCRLKHLGADQPLVQTVRTELDPAQADLQLVLFAGLELAPGTSCAFQVVDAASQKILATAEVEVAAPEYQVINLESLSVTAIRGFIGETVATLEPPAQPLPEIMAQSIVAGEGSFGDNWVVVTAADVVNPDPAVTASTVALYKLPFGATGGQLSPWVDLRGTAQHPWTVRDMIWAPSGPCSLNTDALYLAAPAGDQAQGAADSDGGTYCLAADGRIGEATGDQARTVEIDREGSFFQAGSHGGLLVSRWSGNYLYPGDIEWSVPELRESAHFLRFARQGEHAGHLFYVSTQPQNPLFRISAFPHQVETWEELSSDTNPWEFGPPVLSPAPESRFGDLVVISRRSTSWRSYDLVALFHDQGTLRQLPLIRFLPCGRIAAFDAGGERLAVVTATIDSECSDNQQIQVFSLDLP